jgi:hypothetical protein
MTEKGQLKHYFYVTYSSKDRSRNTQTESTVIDKTPMEWITQLNIDFPDSKYLLLLTMEISEQEYNNLKGRIG